MVIETEVPVKKQVESSKIQIGFGRFCGQSYQLETSGVCDQESLDEWASEKCDCDGAKEVQRMKEQEVKAEINIKNLFGEWDAAPVLRAAVHPVAVGAIDSVTVNIGNGVKATIKLTAKGKIQIKKIKTTEDTAED